MDVSKCGSDNFLKTSSIYTKGMAVKFLPKHTKYNTLNT